MKVLLSLHRDPHVPQHLHYPFSDSRSGRKPWRTDESMDHAGSLFRRCDIEIALPNLGVLRTDACKRSDDLLLRNSRDEPLSHLGELFQFIPRDPCVTFVLRHR